MSKIKSIFSPYSEQLQVMIDQSLSLFAPTWFPKYFDWAPAQVNLSFTSVIGASRIEAAASIVDRSSPAPLRSRADLKLLNGKIPAIKEKFAMTEDDFRDYQSLQSMPVSDAVKKQQLLDLLFGDIKKAGSAAHKRVDILALQAISTGMVNFSALVNPDGIVSGDIDLLMPAENKSQAAVKWSTIATSTPITDITTLVTAARAAGKGFSKILMSLTNFFNFAKSKEVLDSLISFNQLQKGASVATIDKINEYLIANMLPQIEIVDEVIGIEKDGVINTIRPFADDYVSFVPSGKLGVIKNALAIEQMKPVNNVDYGVFDHALISKWSQNDPWSEFTSVELNACPSLEAIDNIYLLKVKF